MLNLPMYDWAFSEQSRHILTDLDVLLRYEERFDWEKLSGCIFHISRCGSTAIANAAREVENILVISEARIVTQFLLDSSRSGLDIDTKLKHRLFGGLIAAILKEAPSSRVILKLPSVFSFDISQTLETLNIERWCFSTRNPQEVIRSMEQRPSGWLAKPANRNIAMSTLNFHRRVHESADVERRRFYAFILEQYLRSGTCAAQSNAQHVYLDYSNFTPDTVCSVIAFLIDGKLSSTARNRVQASLTFYSKATSGKAFIPEAPLTLTEIEDSQLRCTYESYLKNSHNGFAFSASAGSATTLE